MKFYAENTSAVNNLKWYSLKRIFSFCVKFMYLIGGRGYGKTYSVKSFVFSDFVKNGNKFAWVRSTDTALDKIKNTVQFFGRMENLEKIGVKSYAIRGDTIFINGSIAGYFFAVSTFHNTKGADYDCVNGVYDEFMRAKGERPVASKREKFFDLVESVFRSTGARVFLISNATSQYDEMLEPFNVKLHDFGCYLYREASAVIHYIQPSEVHMKNKEDSLSVIGMSDSQKKMSFSNKFSSYGDFGKSEKTVHIFTLQTDDNKFLNIYRGENKLYVKGGEPAKQADGKLFTCDNHYVSSKVKKLALMHHKIMKTYHDNGNIVFENGYCRSAFQELFTK